MRNPYQYILQEGEHKTATYGPFEVWWVETGGGARYYEVKNTKDRSTVPFDDWQSAEQYIGKNGGIAYLVQSAFKDFWNNGFGEFATRYRGMDKHTILTMKRLLKDWIEMHEDMVVSSKTPEKAKQHLEQAKKVMNFVRNAIENPIRKPSKFVD